jgi:hypothetical protein
LASSNKIHHHTVFQHLFLEVLSEQDGIGGLRPVIGPFFVLLNISLPGVEGATSDLSSRKELQTITIVQLLLLLSRSPAPPIAAAKCILRSRLKEK